MYSSCYLALFDPALVIESGHLFILLCQVYIVDFCLLLTMSTVPTVHLYLEHSVPMSSLYGGLMAAIDIVCCTEYLSLINFTQWPMRLLSDQAFVRDPHLEEVCY